MKGRKEVVTAVRNHYATRTNIVLVSGQSGKHVNGKLARVTAVDGKSGRDMHGIL